MPVVTDGGRGTGVEAEGTNFPFVAPSDDVKGLLADFYLSHAVREAVLPLRITWLHGICRAQSSCGSDSSAPSDSPTATHEADVIVKDADGSVVFDSTEADVFRAVNWGGRFRLYEWETATAVCRALAHSGAEEAEDVAIYGFEITPENGILDERTHELMPKRVTSLEVNGEIYSGQIEFVAGYNIDLNPAAPIGKSRRSRNRVAVVAAPGGGLGRFPSCEEPEQVIRRINGTGPTPQGDFIMSATGCYWLERPVLAQGDTATIYPSTLRLNNNCGPCCACSDYENTYNGVRRLYDRFKEIGRRGEEIRGEFKQNIDRWNAQKECRKAHPTRVALGVSKGGYVGVAASFCNTDDVCKYEIDLKVSFVHNHSKIGSLVPCSTVVSKNEGGSEQVELYGSWPEWGNYWPVLDRGRALKLTSRFYFPGSVAGDSVTVTVTPYLSGVAQPTAVMTTSLVICETGS